MSLPAELIFEPDFVENAVFLAMRKAEETGTMDPVMQWRNERNQIYSIRDDQDRDRVFKHLEMRWFTRLRLHSRFEALLGAFPIFQGHFLTIRIRQTFVFKDEGSELYIQRGRKTNLVKFQTVRLFEGDWLERFLCHEWLRLSDMLDPAFQYSPEAPLSGRGELEDNLVRDRYRILWDLSISLRLRNRGSQPLVPIYRQKALLTRAFSGWTEEMRENILREITSQKYQTQSDLLEWARDETLAGSFQNLRTAR